MTVFRRPELSNWLIESFFCSELNTHLLPVWLWDKVRLKVRASITQAAITLLIFLGSFMAASLKIQMSYSQAMLPGTRVTSKSETVPFLGPYHAAAANITDGEWHTLEHFVTIQCPWYLLFSHQKGQCYILPSQGARKHTLSWQCSLKISLAFLWI